MTDLQNALYLYFGNLSPREPQYQSGLFRGLALHPESERDIHHDARDPLPFSDGSVKAVQSQDVFEHLEYEQVASVLDEIFRCLTSSGIFRLSLPDYNSPLLKSRSVYDADGNVLFDAAMGGSVVGKMNGGMEIKFPPGGEAHLWFPTYANVTALIVSSQIRKSSSINFHHAWIDSKRFVCNEFDQSIMPVRRCPPNDMRAGGKPVSIVVDFIK
ncbi:MAG: methyltransferase domain-containing protein [Terriglobales bacterium]